MVVDLQRAVDEPQSSERSSVHEGSGFPEYYFVLFCFVFLHIGALHSAVIAVEAVLFSLGLHSSV